MRQARDLATLSDRQLMNHYGHCHKKLLVSIVIMINNSTISHNIILWHQYILNLLFAVYNL